MFLFCFAYYVAFYGKGLVLLNQSADVWLLEEGDIWADLLCKVNFWYQWAIHSL